MRQPVMMIMEQAKRLASNLGSMASVDRSEFIVQRVEPFLVELSKREERNFCCDRRSSRQSDLDTFRLVHEKIMGGAPSEETEREFLRAHSDIQCEKAFNAVLRMQSDERAKTRVQRVMFHVSVFGARGDCVGWMKRQNAGRKYGGRNKLYPSFYKWQFVYPEKGNKVPEEFYDPPDSGREKYHKFMQFKPSSGKRYRVSRSEIDDGVFFVYEF